MLFLILLSCFYLAFSTSDTPRAIRRYCSMKKVALRKQMGVRDEAKYKMKAGGGADAKYKRQG